MGLCSGSGFQSNEGNVSLRRQVILPHHENTSADGIFQTFINRSTTLRIMGQIFSCSYATSIFKLCEINALKTIFLTFLKFIIHEAYKLATLNIRVDIVVPETHKGLKRVTRFQCL